ncbi:MAG TPA: hypothetical protein VIH41_09380 [Myxococcales bacterium]
MRTSIFAGLATLCVASVARADDTKPPQISDVKAAARGGQVQVDARITDETGVLSAVCYHRAPGGKAQASPMTKSDLDDTFRVSFPGGPESEYWIEASDLLGNGPSTWGSSSKAYAVGGKAAPGKPVASAEPPAPKQEPKRARKTPAPARASEPPAIQYIRPGEPPAEGNPFTMRMRIQSDSPVAVAVLQARAQGTAAFVNLPLTKGEGDTWQAQIPAAMAHGTIEYFIAAKNQAGQMTRQGESEGKPYGLTFKSAPSASSAPAALAIANRPAGPFSFTDDPPARVPPGRPILVRVQVVPPTDGGEMPDRVAVLWRGNDAQDQMTDLVKDETGGWGGFKVELPPQDEGAVFFQIVACDAAATRCGVDTGSRRRWHATAVASQPGAARPLPLDAVSTRAPPSLPE